MFQMLENICNRSEIRRYIKLFYTSQRFYIIQMIYFSVMCLYIFYKSVNMLHNNASSYLLTYFVIIVAFILFKMYLVHKGVLFTIFPSILVWIYFSNTEEYHEQMSIFFLTLHPLLWTLIIKNITINGEYIRQTFIMLFFNTLSFIMFPIVFEILIFIYIVIIFESANIIAGISIINEVLEKEFRDNCIECLICKCEFEKDECMIILQCKHKFHDDCIKTWFKFNNACPLCKQTFLQSGVENLIREIINKEK